MSDITAMGDAGKAMPVPRGRYSDTETYDYLDFVYSGDASYIAKKLTTGNPPAENNEYWQLFARGGTLTENSDVSNTTVTFEAAEERINIFSTDSLKVIMGKIKKWFTDLKPVAFSGKYSDLDATGYIKTLTNFSQINHTYRHWEIAGIDSTYASQLGIERNTGDFNAFVLDYNGDGITFNYGNIILTSPRLGNDYYLVQMWQGVAHVTYSRGDVPTVTNNDLATIPGTAWDAVRGAQIRKDLDKLNSDLSGAKGIQLVTQYISALSTDENGYIYYDFVLSEDLRQYPAPIVQNSYHNNNNVLGTRKVDKNTIRIYFSNNTAPLTVSILYKI